MIAREDCESERDEARAAWADVIGSAMFYAFWAWVVYCCWATR